MGIVQDLKVISNESYQVQMILDDEREYDGEISSEQFGLTKAIWGRTHLHKWDFGYGLTCHTAQGSEFDSVVIFEPSKGFANWLGRQSYSRWLYTAITRAKRNLLLVG
jgi:ATP-dependent exoDNAse (exonuclease V) alpha subunit